MTKKAKDLQRGDVTPMGKVLDKCSAVINGEEPQLTIICQGGRWFSCDSGVELVKVEPPRVQAREVTPGLSLVLHELDCGERRFTVSHVATLKLSDGRKHFILIGHSETINGGPRRRDWLMPHGDDEFEVIP